MKLVQDKNLIRLRSALQNERDVIADNVKVIIEEMFVTSQRNVKEQVPMFSEVDIRGLHNNLYELSSPHLELQTGNLWKGAENIIRQETVRRAGSEILEKIEHNDQDFINYARTLVPMLIEESFIKTLKEHNL